MTAWDPAFLATPPLTDVDDRLPPSHKLFALRTLPLGDIKAVGFDMDHTLARYRSPEIDELAFKKAARLLVRDRGYSPWLLEIDYDPDFAVRGLVLDGLYCGPAKFDTSLAEAIKARRALDAQLSRERSQGIQRPPTPVLMGPFSNDPAEELRKASEVRQLQERAETQRREIYAIGAMRDEGRTLLSVDVCANQADADAAIRAGARDKAPAFAKSGGGDKLDQLPRGTPAFENPAEVNTIATARNWLPILRSDRFGTKGDFINAIADTNYDVVVVDVAHRGADLLVKSDIARLKFKKLGPRRLVLAVMPIGRAFDWRWYWQKDWDVGSPAFLFAHDEAPGTYITDTGSTEWRAVLSKYLTGIMDLGFDGVMFDDVGTYSWFEDLMPLGPGG